MPGARTILFVRDQEGACAFWRAALGSAPRLHVPGMTEFDLPGGACLGLMPDSGIRRLLGDALPAAPAAGSGPRAEIYLLVPDPEARLRIAIDAGATPVAPVTDRTWGDRAGYCLDPDGHLLAFAAPAVRPAPEALPASAAPIDLEAAFRSVDAHWSPRVVAALNGQHVRIARLLGAYHWHRHHDEDELFLVRRGTLEIQFRDRTVRLPPGSLFVVPRGVEHRPVCDAEVEVLLFEPAETVPAGTPGDAAAP